MKRIMTTLLTLVALFGAANAQVSGMSVGYCNGQVKNSGSNEFSCNEENYVSQAIYLPAAILGMYKDCEIRQIHAGLGSTLNVDELKVWVRTSLGGENLAEGMVNKQTTPKMGKGWNTVDLGTTYTITGSEEGLYIGLTFHQTKVSVGMSVLDPTMIEPVPNGLFVQMGTNAAWEDRSTEGVAAIEALVFGDNLPKYNLEVKDLSLDQPSYVIDKDLLSGVVTIRNCASCTTTGFDLRCEISGMDEPIVVPVEETIAYLEEKAIPFSINPGITTTDPEMRTLTMTVCNLREGEEQYPEDNSATVDFGIVKHDYTRNVLIEEFTGEACSNCPRMASIVHNFLEMEGVDERVNVICHHSGFEPDWLTISADRAYTWLFNMDGQTYAPALMMDRATRDYISNSDYADQSPIFSPGSANNLYNTFSRRCKDQAFVCLNISTELDSEGIHVTVTGERSKENFTVNPPRIVVGVIEDNIKARGQANGGPDFVHQHVNRAYNANWGEEIEWNGDEYTYTCDFQVSGNWKLEDLQIVAYIWDYDPENVANCEISNSNRCRFADWKNNLDAVDSISAETESDRYYTLDGMRIAAPQKGVTIVRHANGTTTKILK